MPGYANRILTLPFPELSDDPVNDLVKVVMRNPQLLVLEELVADLDEDADTAPAQRQAMYAKIARLILSWHVYDATTPVVDKEGNELPSVLLGEPTAETVAKLPSSILTQLVNVWRGAANPQ